MGTRPHFIPVIALWAVLGGAPAEATGAATPLSLDEAVRIGLSRNPDIAADRAEADASGADLEAARGARWPSLFAEAGWHRTDQPVMVFGDKLTAAEFTSDDFAIDALNHPDPIDHVLGAVGVNVPLFTSGRIRAQVDAATETSLASGALVLAAESDLVLRITEAWYAVSLAGAAVQVADGAVASASGHERVTGARFENGAALKSDFLRTQVYRLARQSDLERRKADLDLARARLRTLLGLTATEPLDVAPAAWTAPLEPPGELQAWADGAAVVRPEMEAARRGSLAAEATGRGESAARGPEIAGQARYERNASGLGEGEGSYFAGLSIRWTAFDRGRGARIEAAHLRTAATVARTRAAENRTRLEVEQAYREVQVADHNLGAALEAVAAAEEARLISSDRYASGLLPLTTLLDAETALLGARLAEISARYDAVVGRVRLRRAAGRLEVPR